MSGKKDLQKCNFRIAEGRSLEIKESGYIKEMCITALDHIRDPCYLNISIEKRKPLPEQVMDRLVGVDADWIFRGFAMFKDETLILPCYRPVLTPAIIRFSVPVRVVAEFIQEERRVKV